MPPVNIKTQKPSMKFSKGTVKRLLNMVTKTYKKQLIFVFICILISSIASVASPLFLKSIIDDYITPLLTEVNPSFNRLGRLILFMIGVYVIGIVATYIYNRLMSVLAQGVLRNVRNEMFEKMEKLPIKFFDTNTHGDIMSYCTNDADASLSGEVASWAMLFVVADASRGGGRPRRECLGHQKAKAARM